ncbi:Phosphatidate cytidylyltransferase, mitochondrial [Erysiphe neolycopersici]|uniref:Phosphatidate cytidylyltransferase, mitochondrial n=1 Tax=Erysiphe neolycopersici TaxID=212602 RepID=A0A420HBS3_9PEZI|nr:Phosphatidate cytidylyltransferase, mitochondrial [Erysiphe neolycopersici]
MKVRPILSYQRTFILRVTANESFIKTPYLVQLDARRYLVSRSFEKRGGLDIENSISTPSSKDPSNPWNQATFSQDDISNFSIPKLSELLSAEFDINQNIVINDELQEKLRHTLWHFRAPIRYAFVYGSGVFPQSNEKISLPNHLSKNTNASVAVMKAKSGAPKMVDFIFGVSHTQHWHSLNLTQHRDHYSALGSLGSGAVSMVQDKFGAGVYFNPYLSVNGILIKYGVVNIDTLCTDLTNWTTLYLAGRLQKPVKILRDDPRVRSANQTNLISALRAALLLLPSEFTEYELYSTISSLSYIGDLRMTLPTENPRKVTSIVAYNLPNFRRLYLPLIEKLPNICFKDFKYSGLDWISDPLINLRLIQDMDSVKRGNMVRRLPGAFRSKLYFHYQRKYQIPQLEFDEMLEASSGRDEIRIKRCEGGSFEQRIANEPPEILRNEMRSVIKNTVRWPSTSQSLKGLLTAGVAKTWRYVREKIAKNRQGKLDVTETSEK